MQLYNSSPEFIFSTNLYIFLFVRGSELVRVCYGQLNVLFSPLLLQFYCSFQSIHI